MEGVVGSRRSREVERDSNDWSSPLNWDIRPSSRVPQPGDPSNALLSVVMRSGLGDAPAPVAIAFCSSASLTLILLLLLLLGALMCLPGRSLTVCVGDGDRERCREDLLTMTTDWSSEVSVMSSRWSLGLMAGRGFSSKGVLGAPNTSPMSAGAGLGMRAASLGNGGTGGGKASNRGELE